MAIALIAAVVALISYLLIGRFGDRRNIETLRQRFDLDRDEAEELYVLARKEGFGSAYRKVLSGDRVRRRAPRRARAIRTRASSEAPHSRG